MFHNVSGNSTGTEDILLADYPYISPEMKWGIGGFTFSLALVGFIENAFVILLLIFGHGFLDAPTNIFVLSLAFADALLSLASMPLLPASFSYDWASDYLFHASRLAAVGTAGSIVLLSINRMISVLKPLKYPRLMTTRRAAYLVALVWGIGFSVSALSVVADITEILWLKNVGRYVVIISLLATIVSNIFLYKKSRHHQRVIKAQIQAVQPEATSRDSHAIKSILMVTGTFLLGWLPFLLVVIFTNKSTDPQTYYKARYSAYPFTLANALADPIIYFFRFDQFKQFYQNKKRRFFADHDLQKSQTPTAPSGFVISNRVSPI